MTSQLIITLAILAFMIVMFVWQKFPMGVTTMTCCALLAAFGILSPSEAFGGFTNNSIILVAPMMALSSAITKTSIVPYIRNKVNSLSGKKGIVLILFFYLIVIAFVQFIPATATFSIMIVFLASLSNDGEVTPTRLLMPMLGISCAWKGFLPIGMGATSFATINAIYGTIITDEGYWLGMFDKFRVSILPVVCLTIYCLVAWKLLPKRGTVNAAEAKEVKETKTLPKAQETLVYVVFIAVMAVLVLNKWTGKLMTGAEIWLSKEDEAEHQKHAEDTFPAYVTPYTVTNFYDMEHPLTMGRFTITFRLCPGHTPGVTSFFFEDTDEKTGKTYRCALHGGLGVGQMSKEGVIKTGTDPELPHRFIKDCYELAKMPVDIALASHLNQNNILPNIPKDPDDYTVFVADYAWADVLINRAEAVKKFYPEIYGTSGQ